MLNLGHYLMQSTAKGYQNQNRGYQTSTCTRTKRYYHESRSVFSSRVSSYNHMLSVVVVR
jgi:hypothetical protein